MKKILLIAIFILFVTFVLFFADRKTLYAKTMENVNTISEEINNDMSDLILSSNILSYSSSPYEIVANNEDYDKLVSLGVVAVKPLYDKIINSPENGLIEYIYAMAIEDIMSQNFTYVTNSSQLNLEVMEENHHTIEDLNYGWANAKEFAEAFSTYIKEIPATYESIKNNKTLTYDIKIEKMSKIGLGVIPYLIEEINDSTDSIDLAKDALISILINYNMDKEFTDSFSKINDSYEKDSLITIWIDKNFETYDLLKQI